jgi:hypothetical protein
LPIPCSSAWQCGRGNKSTGNSENYKCAENDLFEVGLNSIKQIRMEKTT